MSTLLAIVSTLLIGAAGWFATHFVAYPILKFFRAREEAIEALFFWANIGLPGDGQDDPGRFRRAEEQFRLIAARLEAADKRMWPLQRFVLARLGYNVSDARPVVTALSGCMLTSNRHDRAVARNDVEAALGLPRTYSRESLLSLERAEQARQDAALFGGAN